MTRWFLGFALWFVPSIAAANVVSLSAVADNSLYEEGPTLSNGAGDHFFTGKTDDGYLRRGLLRFDIAGAIPAGSTINAVTLTLNMSRSKANDESVSLHRVTAGWGEGTSHAAAEEGEGDAATANDATWTHRLWPNTTWAAAGGDFVAAASATTVVPRQIGVSSWAGAGLVSDVQLWLDTPAQAFGWIVIGNEVAVKTAKRFDSRTNSDLAARPVLQIDFTPSTPTGACCQPDGSCSEVNHPPSSCPDYQGQSSTCGAVACPQPTGSCCLPNATATCVAVTQAACVGQAGTFGGPLTTCATAACPVVLTPFVDPLPLPAVATPTSGVQGGAASYDVAIVELAQQLHRDLPATRVWGFDDGAGASYPGPTIEAATGEPVAVTWRNDLRDAGGSLRTDHMLNVDICAHGANDQSPRTVIHLHGGHVPAAVDGYPESTFLPGQQVVYEYPNNQQAAPIWYHDHSLGITRLNVYMGMAGFYVVRDATEAALGLPAGEYEVPLAIQDRTFAADGSLVYPASWVDHFFGDTILVNGKVWPYLNVKRGKYRFRLLAGSGSRTYALSLSNSATMQVIGTDGGLLGAPVTVSELTMMPGERYDVVIDFASSLPGTEITLENSAPAPFPGPAGVGVIPNVLKFVVQDAAGYTAALPSSLRPVVPLDPATSVMTRDFELQKGADPCSGSKWLINGLGWDDITEFPQLGTTEIWRFINRSGVSHPMHMHLVFFQVLDRQPFSEIAGVITPTGSPAPPAAHEAGWKDTVAVGPDEIVRVIARFEDYTGRYAYHCHILEHEDHEMMRQFETFTDCGDGAVGIGEEACDDGNLIDGDGCESDCTFTTMGGDMGPADVGGIDAGADVGISDAGPGDMGGVDLGAADASPMNDARPSPDAPTGDVPAAGGGKGTEEGCCRVVASPRRSPPWWLLVGALLVRRRKPA